MYVFVLSSAIVLFGLRPVTRFAWVWLLSLFDVRSALPHTRDSVWAATESPQASRRWSSPAPRPGSRSDAHRAADGSAGLAAWGVGLAVLVVMAIFFPYAPVTVYQEVPALIATALVGLVMFFLARRGQSKRILESQGRTARRQAGVGGRAAGSGRRGSCSRWSSCRSLPAPPIARFAGLQISGPLNPPAGWHITDTTEDYTWVKRLHGRIAHLTRQRMVADVGNPQWDKLSRPRTVMVDNVVTDRPFSFNVYPAKVLYDVDRHPAEQAAPRRPRLRGRRRGRIGGRRPPPGHLEHAAVDLAQRSTRATHPSRSRWTTTRTTRRFRSPSGALAADLEHAVHGLVSRQFRRRRPQPDIQGHRLADRSFGRGLVRAQIEPLGRLS